MGGGSPGAVCPCTSPGSLFSQDVANDFYMLLFDCGGGLSIALRYLERDDTFTVRTRAVLAATGHKTQKSSTSLELLQG